MLPARKEKRVTSNEGELPKTESQKIFQMMSLLQTFRETLR